MLFVTITIAATVLGRVDLVGTTMITAAITDGGGIAGITAIGITAIGIVIAGHGTAIMTIAVGAATASLKVVSPVSH